MGRHCLTVTGYHNNRGMNGIREDIIYFVDRALDGMSAIVAALGDKRANRVPALPGANSAYVILTHCLGVMDYWAGFVAIGRRTDRDREAEFRAAGAVSDLLDKVAAARSRFHDDVASADLDAPVTNVPPGKYDSPRAILGQSSVLLHVLEEVAQHHGQMEITRDIVVGTTIVPAKA